MHVGNIIFNALLSDGAHILRSMVVLLFWSCFCLRILDCWTQYSTSRWLAWCWRSREFMLALTLWASLTTVRHKRTSAFIGKRWTTRRWVLLAWHIPKQYLLWAIPKLWSHARTLGDCWARLGTICRRDGETYMHEWPENKKSQVDSSKQDIGFILLMIYTFFIVIFSFARCQDSMTTFPVLGPQWDRDKGH